jgi:hypothetical protein
MNKPKAKAKGGKVGVTFRKSLSMDKKGKVPGFLGGSKKRG